MQKKRKKPTGKFSKLLGCILRQADWVRQAEERRLWRPCGSTTTFQEQCRRAANGGFVTVHHSHSCGLPPPPPSPSPPWACQPMGPVSQWLVVVVVLWLPGE